ncbi:hypothetical protein L6452_19745 [Arctium lappa]|uniref:Uncharacterized protein n=1 Tax=Arctium lappa TaxID=4217 RepID=A0ACB9BA81_ARCLA|nr:hypothetical protein L6452_19745 [Arctium lappa]
MCFVRHTPNYKYTRTGHWFGPLGSDPVSLKKQQFEQAKLSWWYSLGTKANLEAGPSAQILELYNKAENNMEHGMQIWEELEEQRLNGLSFYDKYRDDLVNLGLEGLLKDVSTEEAAEQAAHLRSQMYILWGTLLYERSVVEFKMGLSAWEESLATSVEKFELVEVSPMDLAVIIKNHCSNGTTSEGNLDILIEKMKSIQEQLVFIM